MTDRAPSFPFDWLAPGESQYCPRCGLFRTNAPLCLRCRSGDREGAAYAHASLEAEAACIAEIRRGIEAVPPLFWMG